MNKIFKEKKVRLEIPSQEGVPGQSINVALGQYGVNISNFLKEFNDKSNVYPSGMILKVEAFISFDGSFKIEIKGPSVLYLIKSLSKNKENLEKKDILLLLYFIRKYRFDLRNLSDYSLSKSFLGTFKSSFLDINAFKK